MSSQTTSDDKVAEKVASKEQNVVQELTTESISGEREYVTDYADEYNPEGLVVAVPSDRKKYKVTTTRPPFVCYLILCVEFAERGSYYGVQGILNNFIQRPLPAGSTTGRAYDPNDSAGALGMGLSAANGLTMLLQFLAYVMPLFGGYLADAKTGKFRAIMYGVWVGLVSHILFVIAAIPKVIAGGHGVVALAFAIISLSIGTGLIKPNLLPLLLDQYPYRCDVLKKLPDGTITYIDRERSMESITMVFYWSINAGAFLQLGTTYAARDVGYWLAFLCPGILYLVVCVVMILCGPRLKQESPEGSILGTACKVLKCCLGKGFLGRIRKNTFWTHAYPDNIKARGDTRTVSWTTRDVKDYKIIFGATVIFLYWIFFNLNDTGLGSSLTSLAGAMSLNGVPNDLFTNFNQITIIVAIPIENFIIYPALIKMGFNFKQVYKIFLGFMVGAISSMIAAILQWRVYKTSPCGWYATTCDDVSPISAWYVAIVYALAALGETLCYTEVYELAYLISPPKSSGLTMALFLLTNAFSAAISEAVSPALSDPHLIYPFAAIAIAGAVVAVIFLIRYWNLDKMIAQQQLEYEEDRKQSEVSADEEKLDAPRDLQAAAAEMSSIVSK